MFYKWNGYRHKTSHIYNEAMQLKKLHKNNVIWYGLSIVKDKLPFDSFVYVCLCIYEENHINMGIIDELS